MKKLKTNAKRRIASNKKAKKRFSPTWVLKLYVAGKTPKSVAAFNNLKAICEEHLKGIYEIKIIDLIVEPQLARGDQILAIPTLVKQLPNPIKKIIGDLSDTESVLVGLDIKTVRSK